MKNRKKFIKTCSFLNVLKIAPSQFSASLRSLTVQPINYQSLKTIRAFVAITETLFLQETPRSFAALWMTESLEG